MTESFRSAVAFRNDICQSIADLQQRATAPLPAAATVFVTDASAFYRLAKGVGNIYDALIGRVVIPADGSSNRWVQEEAYGSSPWSGVEAMLTLNNIPAAGAGVWAPLGTNPGSFALAAGDLDMFEVDPLTSLMTYHGLPRYMLLTAVASLDTANSNLLSIVISKDNDVPAGSSVAQYLKGEQSATGAPSALVNIVSQRSSFVAPGSTFRLMARSFLGVDTIQFQQFTLSAVPL